MKQFQNSFENFSNKTAFHINNNDFSYGELAQFLSNIRNYIKKVKENGEELIGIADYDDIYTYASIYAALFAGLGYVPLNPENPVDRNKSIIEQAGLKTLLTCKIDEDIEKIVASTGIKSVETTTLPESKIDLSVIEIDENKIAYILFTSGSTGVPKGVPITRKNLAALLDAFYTHGYKIDENDRFLQMFDLTFDFSVICYMAPPYCGASIYTVPKKGIKFANVYSILEEKNISFACMVPSILAYLRPYFEEISLPSIKYTLFCGEALYEDLCKEWLQCIPKGTIINAYGPTEATVFCMLYDWDHNLENQKTHNGILTIGKSMKNMGSVVVDEDSKAAPVGVKGELCLYGEQVTPGYWKDEQKNKEAFFELEMDGKEQKLYRTGDLAAIDNEGDFFYHGRKDFQVKIQGFRVELSEIEHHARTFCNIMNVVVIPHQNSTGSTLLHLFIENYKGKTEDIVAYMETKVPYYMVPNGISTIPVFPLNQNGKIDRKKLESTLNNKEEKNG